MATIIIQSDNSEKLRLLIELAQQLGASVTVLFSHQTEDHHLGLLMRKEKTGKTVSKKVILNHLKN